MAEVEGGGEGRSMIPDDRGTRWTWQHRGGGAGMFPANATPASANQVRHTPASARGNKSTDVSPGGYAEERHYLWSFVSVATVRKRVEPMRLGLCVAPRDSRHRNRQEILTGSTVTPGITKPSAACNIPIVSWLVKKENYDRFIKASMSNDIWAVIVWDH